MLEYTYETKYNELGYKYVCGVDEAGRGPLFGPVVAAACILPAGLVIEGLNDSKKLTEKKREKLYDEIIKNAITYGIAEASVEEIDKYNILEASLLAMRRAIAKLSPAADFALIDGNVSRGFEIGATAIIGGDRTSPSIAAASILAKVTRDRLCIELDKQYPEYGLAKHKGYSTEAHVKNIIEHGMTPLHRQLFCNSAIETYKRKHLVV